MPTQEHFSVEALKPNFTQPLAHLRLEANSPDISVYIVRASVDATNAATMLGVAGRSWNYEISASQSTVDAEQLGAANIVRYFVLAQKCDWLVTLNSPSVETSADEVSNLIEKLYVQIKQNDFSLISRAISDGIMIERARPEMLAGLLRGTFLWRKKIEGWNKFLERTRKELSRRGYSDALLKGLDRE